VTEAREKMLASLGFKFSSNGSHAARTMMLADVGVLCNHHHSLFVTRSMKVIHNWVRVRINSQHRKRFKIGLVFAMAFPNPANGKRRVRRHFDAPAYRFA